MFALAKTNPQSIAAQGGFDEAIYDAINITKTTSWQVEIGLIKFAGDIRIEQETVALDTLLSKPTIREKKDGAAWIPATFREGGKRCKADVVTVNALVYDFDSGTISMEEALHCAEGLQAIAHTSYSHTPEHPKFRLVIYLSHPIPKGQFAAVWQAMAARFPAGAVDISCKDSARLYYLPAAPKERAHLFEYIKQKGTPFNWEEITSGGHAEKLLQGFGIAPNITKTAEIGEGGRNATLHKIACGLRGRGAEFDEIIGELLTINQTQCKPPLDAEEVATIARSVMNYEPNPVRVNDGLDNATQIAAAEAAYKLAAGRVVWVRERKMFFACGDDGIWRPDPDAAKRLIKAVIDHEGQQAAELMRADFQAGKTRANQVAKMMNDQFISGAANLFRLIDGATVSANVFDANKYLVAMRGGKCIDLQTMQVRDIQPSDYFTMNVNAEYVAGAQCPLWRSGLKVWTCGDVALERYLQKLFGLLLSGEVTQSYYTIYGQGANGKSIYIAIANTLLGSYAASVAPESLMLRNGDSSTNDIARLQGKRLVSSVELPEEKQLNENIIKQITGGDEVTCRFLYGEWFSFTPVCKLFMVGNYRPILRGGEAIFRRVVLIPFNATIPESERDPLLLDKLRGEMSGVLNWALEGWQLYKREGLQMPEVVASASKSYCDDSDLLGGFIDECCDTGGDVTGKRLYQAFRGWCEAEGLKHVMTQRGFARRLEVRCDVVKRKTMVGVVWAGVSLKKTCCY